MMAYPKHLSKKDKTNLVFGIYFKLTPAQNYLKYIILDILRTISKEVWKPNFIIVLVLGTFYNMWRGNREGFEV